MTRSGRAVCLLPANGLANRLCRLLPGRRTAFHESLGILGGVLTAEVHIALWNPFVSGKRRVLTDAEVRVRRLEEWALVRERLRRLAVPERRHSGKHLLQVGEAVPRIGAHVAIAVDGREWRARGHGIGDAAT